MQGTLVGQRVYAPERTVRIAPSECTAVEGSDAKGRNGLLERVANDPRSQQETTTRYSDFTRGEGKASDAAILDRCL